MVLKKSVFLVATGPVILIHKIEGFIVNLSDPRNGRQGWHLTGNIKTYFWGSWKLNGIETEYFLKHNFCSPYFYVFRWRSFSKILFYSHRCSAIHLLHIHLTSPIHLLNTSSPQYIFSKKWYAASLLHFRVKFLKNIWQRSLILVLKLQV